jgi:transketolase
MVSQPAGSALKNEGNESMDNQKQRSLDGQCKEMLGTIANTIRQLSMDGVQKANSGHPGLPLGCAELGAYLYGHLLRHNPKNPKCLGRDRFILSAGHGSMFLYSCLHLAGFDLSLDDLKNFRQLHSKTPGHPEARDTEGVETTTGPLGQGVANAVGQALGLKILSAKFDRKEHKLLGNAKVYTLAGDGCIMEGVCAEASSFAAHMNLNNLVLIHDANKITLDGALKDSCTEDVIARYKAYGWDVYEIDGHNFDDIHSVFSKIKEKQDRPVMVVAHTIIGKGSPNKQGTHKVHGSPLGVEEVKATKEALGLPDEDFFIPQSVQKYFGGKCERDAKFENSWNALFLDWQAKYPEDAKVFDAMLSQHLPGDLEQQLWNLEVKSPLGGRTASQATLNALAAWLPQMYGGSADLSCSDMTMIKEEDIVAPKVFKGRNIKYGIREFAMAAIATGMHQTQLITPFVGTFLTFSDYMRNAIRLASLAKEQVIYQFTHDSIFLGEDGPTHQPVEHYAALRCMPNLHFFRPADNNEVKMAWLAALKYQGPSAFSLSRQNLPTFDATRVPFAEGVGRGAYIVKKEKEGTIDYTLVATGSELSLAFDVADELAKHDKNVRVVSMPCWELFEQQNSEYRASIFGGDIGKRVSVEAGVDQGWHKYVGSDGVCIAVEGYGASAPIGALQEEYGFNVESILDRIL